MWFKVKKHIIFHILFIIIAPLCFAFLKRIGFYKAHRSEKRGVLWLASYLVLWVAEYLKRVREMLRPLPYCDAVSRHNDTKTIKPVINEAFVASSGDIITDYNVFNCLGVTPNSRRLDALIGGAWFDSKSHSRIFAGCYYDHAILAVWGCWNVWFHIEQPVFSQEVNTQPIKIML